MQKSLPSGTLLSAPTSLSGPGSGKGTEELSRACQGSAVSHPREAGAGLEFGGPALHGDLPAWAASNSLALLPLHPLGEGAVLQGALPLEKTPATPGPLQALGLGSGYPSTRHRPWAGRGRGGQTPLEVCWSMAAPSPLPLQPQEAPAQSERGPHSGHPGSRGHCWGPGIFCWSTEPRA